MCGNFYLPACFQLNATQPFAIKRPFSDNGRDLPYFNWKAAGDATTVAADTTTGAYKVTTTAAGAVTLTSTTPAVFVPRQTIEIINTLGACAGP